MNWKEDSAAIISLGMLSVIMALILWAAIRGSSQPDAYSLACKELLGDTRSEYVFEDKCTSGNFYVNVAVKCTGAVFPGECKAYREAQQ